MTGLASGPATAPAAAAPAYPEIKQPFNRHSPALRRGQLLFDASFESGNLSQVKLISECEYDLWIRPDSNNTWHRLWFYFTVSNCKENQRVVFNVVNFSKTRSLYREGMAPVLRSTGRPVWERMPPRAAYFYKSNRHRMNYVMTFIFTFDRASEAYSFAYCFPYTYTALQQHLHGVARQALPFVRLELLCRTVLHRRLDMLTITAPENMEPGRRRTVVFVTARVHPGETPASFVCQGLIDFLVSSHPAAAACRSALVFKIVPMLNPDGVALGNYRCSALGLDLNRQWLASDAECTPTIHAVKQEMCKVQADGDSRLAVYLDIHGHTTSLNGFVFCNVKDDPEDIQREIAWPRTLAALCRGFSLSGSKFCRDPAKSGAARRALAEVLDPPPHCYTLEVSFYAAHDPAMPTRLVPFLPATYAEMGRAVGLSFLEHFSPGALRALPVDPDL